MVKLTKIRSARIAAILGLCAVACAGPGTVAAEAVQVAGQAAVGSERTMATDTVTVRLTQGNPNDDGHAPAGKIQGVTIRLARLAGLDPNSASDVARLQNANWDEVRNWRTDMHAEKVTDANGEVTFGGLANGFYVVTSTAPDDSYREISPFVVVFPFHTVVDNPNPVPGVIVAKTHKPGETPTPTTTPHTTPPTTPTTSPSHPNTPQTTPNYPPTNPGKPPHQPETTAPGSPNDGKTSTPTTPSGNGGSLAMTGAQVLGVVAGALALIATGFVMIAFSRRKTSESEGR